MQPRHCQSCGVKLPPLDASAGDSSNLCETCEGLRSPNRTSSTETRAGKAAPVSGRMGFYFCENCGRRVTEVDLAAGRGRNKQLRGVFCRECSEGVLTVAFDAVSMDQVLKEEQARRAAGQPSSNALQPISPPVLNGESQRPRFRASRSHSRAILWVAGACVVLVAVLIALLFVRSGTDSGRKPDPASRQASAPRPVGKDPLQSAAASGAMAPPVARNDEPPLPPPKPPEAAAISPVPPPVSDKPEAKKENPRPPAARPVEVDIPQTPQLRKPESKEPTTPAEVVPEKQPAVMEPTYNGKTADQWLVLLKSKDRDRRWRALCALGFLPAQSQETLNEIIKYLGDPQMRYLAVSALVPYGARAKPALPKLLEMLGEPHLDLNTGRAANKVIGAIGPDAESAVPLLIRRLRAPRNHRGGEEAVTLCQIGTPEAVKAVIDHIDFEQGRHGYINTYIEALGYAGEKALPELLRMLADPPKSNSNPNPNLPAVLKAIALVGPPAKAAIPLLEKYAQSKLGEPAACAQHALLTVAPEQMNPAEVIPVMVQQVGTSYGTWTARALLIAFGRRAVPEILKALAANPPYAPQLLETLEKMNGEAHDALPAVTAMARDPQNKVRWSALRILGPLGMSNEEWVPILIEALSDPRARSSAATGLRLLGSAAVSALPELRKYKKDPDEDVRMEVGDALRIIELESKDVPAVKPPRPPEDF